jgi:hypothetical protein
MEKGHLIMVQEERVGATYKTVTCPLLGESSLEDQSLTRKGSYIVQRCPQEKAKRKKA